MRDEKRASRKMVHDAVLGNRLVSPRLAQPRIRNYTIKNAFQSASRQGLHGMCEQYSLVYLSSVLIPCVLVRANGEVISKIRTRCTKSGEGSLTIESLLLALKHT